MNPETRKNLSMKIGHARTMLSQLQIMTSATSQLYMVQDELSRCFDDDIKKLYEDNLSLIKTTFDYLKQLQTELIQERATYKPIQNKETEFLDWAMLETDFLLQHLKHIESDMTLYQHFNFSTTED